MRRVTGNELGAIRPFFEAAAVVAQDAICHRAKCGTVIVQDGEVIGSGYNGPALDDETNRMCEKIDELDLAIKPKYDKTCCPHAEVRAIFDALKHHADKIAGAALYFMRVNDEGEFTDAGEPYCTNCSRYALDSGIGKFVLWSANGADVYDTDEYNRRSYEFFDAS